MNRIEIYRQSDNRTQTLGEGQVVNEVGGVLFQFKTLELPWENNTQRISCIPAGLIYMITKHESPKFGECYWVKNVPNRSEVLIHPGNYHTQILGCILPGRDHIDINGDGQLDVTSSKATMTELLSYDCTELVIYG